jgi:hypothetical protein
MTQQNSRCRGTKRNGERCTLPATGPEGLCWAHDPANAEQRRRTASKAGTARSSAPFRVIQDEVKELIRQVREEEFDPTAANAINRLYQTLLQFMLAERGIFREEDLAERITRLERTS